MSCSSKSFSSFLTCSCLQNKIYSRGILSQMLIISYVSSIMITLKRFFVYFSLADLLRNSGINFTPALSSMWYCHYPVQIIMVNIVVWILLDKCSGVLMYGLFISSIRFMFKKDEFNILNLLDLVKLNDGVGIIINIGCFVYLFRLV